MKEVHSYPVIITASQDTQWDEGLGRLYEPFANGNEDAQNYSILHIEASVNVPHGRCGYYLLIATQIVTARACGLVITDAQGDQYGYHCPEPFPSVSLEEALRGIPLSVLQSEGY